MIYFENYLFQNV
ncbi:hypothetical protein CAEBREN_15024 [Caenorhabditis brenneri]|uniref:Uncharacterized protein n=1 Tax=Caenorhabditis brenneri TaxID=135651 RepID=G0NIA1_CAEBE|nr:hypothetical protein CAEBREN_15024 [Caenorhabditis brenneri]